MDLDGNVLWQIGETNPDNGAFITCDLPLQIYDIDGDGRDEIILWNKDRIFIYTQDNVVKGDVHSPRRYPTYDASNYRGEYAYRD